MIDVSESRANHQSTEDGAFYQRVGGRAVRLTAQQIEARRVRLTRPALVGRVDRVVPVLAYPHEDHLFVELKIRVVVTNTGPVAALHWQVVPEGYQHVDDARPADYVARHAFPPRSRDSFIRVGDRTLLPGGQDDEEVDLGLRLRSSTRDAARIRAEIDALLLPDVALQFRLAHDTDRGRSIQAPLSLDRDSLVAAIVKLLPPA